MKSFNEYFESKKLAQEERENSIVEQKRKKQIVEEQRDAGWESFEGNQSAVDMYVDWITRHST